MGGGRFAPAVNKERLLYFGIIAIVTVLLHFGSPLNPFSVLHPNTDEHVWMYFANGMLEGQIPYVDMFDHKGILLYFIYVCGALLSFGSVNGIWVLAILFVLVGLYFNYRIGYILTSSEKVAFLSTLLMASLFGYFVIFSASKEQFAFPFIFASLYLFILHNLHSSSRPKIEMIVIGFCGGCVLLITPTLAILWLAIGIWLILEAFHSRKFVNSCDYLVCILIGVLISVLPQMLWLYVAGAFESFIECYFLFNFGYTENGISSLSGIYSQMLLLKFILTNAAVVFAELVLLFTIINRNENNIGLNKVCLFSILFYLICLPLTCFMGIGAEHYMVTLLPCLSVPFALGFSRVCHVVSKTGMIRWKQYLVLLLCVGIIGVGGIGEGTFQIVKQNSPIGLGMSSSATIYDDEEKMIDIINSYANDGDYVQVLGMRNYIYLETDTISPSRFNFLSGGVVSSDMVDWENDILTSIITKPTKIIVEDKARNFDMTAPTLMDYIQQNYITIMNTENYNLYLDKGVYTQ